MGNDKKLISIVVPVFNEETNIEPLYAALIPILEQLDAGYDFELLFTDNHSTDRTFEILRRLALKDTRIRVLRFSRNFGFQRSIYTGYVHARGQAAIQIDQSGSYILVVDDQHKVEQRRIQTGPNRGADVVITSGLKEGEKVIVDGIQKVRPGQVVQEASAASAGG